MRWGWRYVEVVGVGAVGPWLFGDVRGTMTVREVVVVMDRARREAANAAGWRWIDRQGVYLWWDGERYQAAARWDGSTWQISSSPPPSTATTAPHTVAQRSLKETDTRSLPPPKRKRPGWRGDPEDEQQQRYWDGEAWTDARVPRAFRAPVSVVSDDPSNRRVPPEVRLAQFSMLFGALGIPFFFLGVPVLAIIFAAQSMTYSRNAGTQRQPMALAGLVLGCIGGALLGAFMLSIDWDALR